jgi:redox-sensing transcriptional repressor
MALKKIPSSPSIKRLPQYLHVIKQFKLEGHEYISATQIAKELSLESIQVRKDLSISGIVGKPKIGYPIVPLITSIEHFLGWDSSRNVIIIGAGNLASALLGYSEFPNHGLIFVAAFDSNPEKQGKRIHGVPVFSMKELNAKVKSTNADIAVLTVPSTSAQDAADQIVQAGIKAVWNFTNVKIKLPSDVTYQHEDLTSGYAMLCVKINTNNFEN